MKLKRTILSACAVAIATCAVEPGLVRSVAPAVVARALADPLSLLDRRSPGKRDDHTTIDTKARLHPGGATGAAPGGAGHRVPAAPLAGAPVIGGDGPGPLAVAGEGPGVPGFPGSGDGAGPDWGGGWGEPDLGGVTGPGGLAPGIPGGPGGGDGSGQPDTPPGGSTPPGGGTPPCCDTGGGGGGGGPTSPVPVPEPATWLMLILGFAVTGAAMRKEMRGERRGAAKART